jgi:hypothetical protein
MRKLLLAVACVGGLAASTVGASAQNAYCDSYARDYANKTTNTAGSVVGGAVTGGVIGAIVGGGRGAAIGAGVGAVGGAAVNSASWNNAYQYAYNNCIRGNSAPVYYQPLQPWTPAWYQACSSKYKSFNPNTGTWTDKYGQQHMCQI